MLPQISNDFEEANELSGIRDDDSASGSDDDDEGQQLRHSLGRVAIGAPSPVPVMTTPLNATPSSGGVSPSHRRDPERDLSRRDPHAAAAAAAAAAGDATAARLAEAVADRRRSDALRSVRVSPPRETPPELSLEDLRTT